MEKALIILFLFFSLNSFAKNSSLEFVGTFNSVALKQGKMVKIPSFEKLPAKWEKNDQYYTYVLLHDPKNEIKTKKISVVIELLKDKEVLKSVVVPEKNVKKIGNKFFINSFSDVVPSIYGAPYTVRYKVTAGELKLSHDMQIQEAD